MTTNMIDVHDEQRPAATDLVSRVTDAVIEDMQQWQSRPLDSCYPGALIDAIVLKIRDGQVRNRPVYVAMGISVDGERGVLGLWAGPVGGGEGAKQWMTTLTELLFRLALESPAPGTAWHAVADEGHAVRDIAAVVGRRLGLPVEHVPDETFGPFGLIFAMDQSASSTYTRETLGWHPTHPSLLEDLENIEPLMRRWVRGRTCPSVGKISPCGVH